MITLSGDYIVLETRGTTYAMKVLPSGHIEHLYYGRRLNTGGNPSVLEALSEKHAFPIGNAATVSEESALSLEDVCLEMSTLGAGDTREPMLEVVDANGRRTGEFCHSEHHVSASRTLSAGLPLSKGDAEELVITLKDLDRHFKLDLIYTVFDNEDVITRRAVLTNEGDGLARVERCLSMLVDLTGTYTMTTFTGAWAREMKRTDQNVRAGRLCVESRTGSSSSRANPFVMLHRNACEDYGEAYGFNLIYSGNHYESTSVSSYGKTRFVSGINPEGFSWLLKSGESFETPEAVMSYSCEGFNGLSHHMHDYVNKHIVPEPWQFKERPVLLNSWEACYFDINARKLTKMAKAAGKLGIELFVMDDGWFGARDDDTSSLGDWRANTKKLPGGLEALGKDIHALGLKFGVWMEPEMVSQKSDLYATHPDWILGREEQALGRHQYMLDLSRTQVQDYIIDSVSDVIERAKADYIKWDYNRNFTDLYSNAREPERQGETAHRYILGLCRIMDALVTKYPHVLFEGCASGGNRFDLGVLSYFPQIWASDDTDPVCRAEMQWNYSYGYPLSTIGAHVSSSPNHQTLRRTPLTTRFNVASFGVLGYECNVNDARPEDLKEMAEEIKLYKDHRMSFQYGRFYRGKTFADGDGSALTATDGRLLSWNTVSEDKSDAMGMIMRALTYPNDPQDIFAPKGLDEGAVYHMHGRELSWDLRDFGDLVNTSAPIHVRQDSALHNTLAKFVHMDGEKEDVTATGSVMMAGVKLHQAYGATGYSGDVRHFPDFASRLYFLEKTSADDVK